MRLQKSFVKKSIPRLSSIIHNSNTNTLTPMLMKMNDINSRSYHMTSRKENPLFYGGVAILAGVAIMQMGLKVSELAAKRDENVEKIKAESENEDSADNKEKKRASSREDASFFGSWFARNFYQGGFEDKMTKREAALILGVREHADVSRIKEAHRKILVLNHPDRGGSPLISAKINEAKELLLKGRDH